MQNSEKKRMKVSDKKDTATILKKLGRKREELLKKRKMVNPEHVREIGKQSVKKRKEQNPEHIKEINKKSFRKRKQRIQST